MTTTTSTTAAGTRTSRRSTEITLWVLQVLVAVVFAFSALGKLTAEAQNVAGFEAMGLGVVGMYVIGVLELAGAIGVLVPRLVGLAATCLVALMIGAVIATFLTVPAMVVVPGTVLVLVAVLAWFRRGRTAALLTFARR